MEPLIKDRNCKNEIVILFVRWDSLNEFLQWTTSPRAEGILCSLFRGSLYSVE